MCYSLVSFIPALEVPKRVCTLKLIHLLHQEFLLVILFAFDASLVCFHSPNILSQPIWLFLFGISSTSYSQVRSFVRSLIPSTAILAKIKSSLHQVHWVFPCSLPSSHCRKSMFGHPHNLWPCSKVRIIRSTSGRWIVRYAHTSSCWLILGNLSLSAQWQIRKIAHSFIHSIHHCHSTHHSL